MAPEHALVDLQPTPERILAEVVEGLSHSPRWLPSKYFYDAEGSRLFEAITRQPEYTLTRTELTLLEAVLPQIASAVGPGLQVVEYGSGSGRKTGLLLAGLDDVVAYAPVEISRSALEASVARLRAQFPAVEMLPVLADFTRAVELPAPRRPARDVLVFFPGSTLGNFTHAQAVGLLAIMRALLGPQGHALVGFDLDKDPRVLEAAYNDAAGVTAAFTLNLLRRLNREIGSDFDLDGFAHRAVYAGERMRIETSLVSLRAQTVRVGGHRFAFTAGEAIAVEISQKYTRGSVAGLAAEAGLRLAGWWTDADHGFALGLLAPD
ncbi:L-histidine N(alpha)-methyltransferase [Luteimonas yindakuii]|uniref:L-histidine N(alpha)-methyltransferase n=1 Tax=Luteimonas yindakuii TaxID=2565782 RepID=UPI0011078C5C|nr:L-histidine N(alpha)-methyltransferase [Luteimonas yindakuii]QCO68663.2 L-histidine N(alpha)-methyltransferase [Luteimonas yindakuii]